MLTLLPISAWRYTTSQTMARSTQHQQRIVGHGCCFGRLGLVKLQQRVDDQLLLIWSKEYFYIFFYIFLNFFSLPRFFEKITFLFIGIFGHIKWLMDCSDLYGTPTLSPRLESGFEPETSHLTLDTLTNSPYLKFDEQIELIYLHIHLQFDTLTHSHSLTNRTFRLYIFLPPS